MQTKHTPGPWMYQASAGGHDWLIYSENPDGKDIAIVRQFHEANAALIAAVPELLALVLDALDDPDGDMLGSEWVRDARAAILKATGGEV